MAATPANTCLIMILPRHFLNRRQIGAVAVREIERVGQSQVAGTERLFRRCRGGSGSRPCGHIIAKLPRGDLKCIHQAPQS
jgi:hypothetical protein